MHENIKVNSPGGQRRGKDLESANSDVRVLGELGPILLLGLGLQFPDLQSVRKNL